MYPVGERIFYSKTGVCCVEALEEKAPGKLYYVLRPLYQDCRVFIPAASVESGAVFTRPVLSREEALELLRTLPELDSEPYVNPNLNQLKDHYAQQIHAPSCKDLALLLISIYRKRHMLAEKKRKLTVVDERFLGEAEDLLFGEIAAALDIPREEARERVTAALNTGN